MRVTRVGVLEPIFLGFEGRDERHTPSVCPGPAVDGRQTSRGQLNLTHVG